MENAGCPIGHTGRKEAIMVALAFVIWMLFEATRIIFRARYYQRRAVIAWLITMFLWYLLWTPWVNTGVTMILWPGSIIVYYFMRDLKRTKTP
jgi:hypothetical protein